MGHRLPLAIVTGASSGIGLHIARLLAERNYRTVLIARREKRLDDLAAELSRFSPSVALPMDLADVDSIDAALAPVFESEGPASVVINCAALGVYAPFEQQNTDVLSRIMRINHEAPVRIIRAAWPGFVELKRLGQVVHVMNICSSSARVGAWGLAGYAASKGAMRALTEVLASEHHNDGIRFTLVYPGIVATPYFEQPNMDILWQIVKRHAISPEHVARKVVDAIGTRRTVMYVPAHYRLIDLLYALSPAAALRIVRQQSQPSQADASRLGAGAAQAALE